LHVPRPIPDRDDEPVKASRPARAWPGLPGAPP
jgi:hypothetical protein